MKNARWLFIMPLTVFLAFACRPEKIENLTLWYTDPATKWEEALPIGNGRLGAMIYGNPREEHIQFNEETLWAGEPRDYSHDGAFSHLDEIRNYLWKGRQKEAEKLALETFMSVPLRQQKYQPFGDLKIRFEGHDSISAYRRELDISEAVCRTSYMADGVLFTREYLASYPDNIIAIKLGAGKRKSLNFEVFLTALHEGYTVSSDNNGSMELMVKVRDGVLQGSARIKILAKNGEVISRGNSLQVRGADAATIWLVAATSFLTPSDVSGNPSARSAEQLSYVEGKSWTMVREAHVTDYKNYFDRFSIDLGGAENRSIPTDERIIKITEKMDNDLAALYVQFGRYLLLSSSRPGTYPANLQGIWNDRLNPSWDSKYTVNINTEMNYWPAEVLNIQECHEPLFRMLEEVVPAGEKVAKVHYNARGWVLHHNTDIWRGAAPINASDHGIWPTGSGWLTHHYWEHFLYSLDTAFLRDRAWPVMKGAAKFYVDYLVTDPEKGWLVSTPSNSPENGGLVAGPTMDHQIIKSLFKACIDASELLGVDKEFSDTLAQMLPKIAPYQIGRFGQLQEWLEDIDNPDNKHRHVSHLWGVHPGKEINWKDTPELMDAAKVSLIARGDEGTGWSLAWKINFWARFRDGDHAYNMVRMLLRPAGLKGPQAKGGGSAGGGSYPNLFDAHPPFQIDGNFGGAAGIVEMLLQSHLDAIDILPALPSSLPSGEIRGIRARGGFELDLIWKEGKLYKLKILSKAGAELRLRYMDKNYSSSTSKGELIEFDAGLNRI